MTPVYRLEIGYSMRRAGRMPITPGILALCSRRGPPVIKSGFRPYGRTESECHAELWGHGGQIFRVPS